MRMIDADALIAQMEADAEHMEEPIAAMFAYAAISDVKHAPTIEPERKKGKWIKMSDADGIFYACSDCGEWHEEISNYCPNCGTRMDMKGDSDG